MSEELDLEGKLTQKVAPIEPIIPPVEPKVEPVLDPLKDTEKRIDEKLLELKKLKYEKQLNGTSQAIKQESAEEKSTRECNEYLSGTGFQI